MHHIKTLTKIDVKINKCELPTFYWLPKLHKRAHLCAVTYMTEISLIVTLNNQFNLTPYKSRFISNSSHWFTTILSKHITSAVTAVKDRVIKQYLQFECFFAAMNRRKF